MYCYRLTGEESGSHGSFVLLRVRELMKSKDRKSILISCFPDQHFSFSTELGMER